MKFCSDHDAPCLEKYTQQQSARLVISDCADWKVRPLETNLQGKPLFLRWPLLSLFKICFMIASALFPIGMNRLCVSFK